MSVVIPCFNEELVMAETHRRLAETLGSLAAVDLELVYVDDGSRDRTLEILETLQSEDSRVRVVGLSRNFGHQTAVTAGLEHALGDVLVVIDADLQDPPSVIPTMLDRWRAGVDVAYGVRTEREGETAFKKWSAQLFYRFIDRLSDVAIPLDTGDFRLMDRRVVDALLCMPEKDRFLRGMVAWLGFRQEAVPYKRAARFAGETKYPLRKMLRFAIDGLLSFSIVPLRLATFIGFFVAAVSVVAIIYALFMRIFTNDWVTGWTLLFISIMFIGGVQLFFLGIFGEYIGRIYGEVKRRPLYFIKDRFGFDAEHSAQSDRSDLER